MFAAPSWQSASAGWAATTCGTERLVADVAAAGDPKTGVSIYDSTPIATGGPAFGWESVGGTSIASPILAAEFALAGGSRGVDYPAATLYAHLGDPNALYDVVSGNTGVCQHSTACTASVGIDGPSGVGSPIGLTAFDIAGSPSNAGAPAIEGDPEAGQVLTERNGEWHGNASRYSYQWARCERLGENCQAIPSATTQNYTLTTADINSTIRVQETASNAFGLGAPAISSQTALVRSGIPTIRNVTPSSAITGNSVVITGEPFSGASQVRFGAEATRFDILSPTQIEAVVPSGAGPSTISVTTPVGTAKSAREFRPTLSVTGFKPNHGVAGTPVIITGVGFTRTSKVSFAGTPATSVTYISSDRLKAIVPLGVSTGSITVTNTAKPVGTVSSNSSYLIA